MTRNMFAALLAVQLVALQPAWSVPVAPEKHVQSTIEHVKEVVNGQANNNSIVLDKKLKDILYPLFDFEKMSRASLGPNWEKASPDEQKAFVALFSDLLARTYLKRIKTGVANNKIDVEDASVDGAKATVKTTVTAGGQPVSIDYRLEADGDTWRVYDVIIENVGLVSNYRSEFGETVRKEGMQGLIERLRAKEQDAKKS